MFVFWQLCFIFNLLLLLWRELLFRVNWFCIELCLHYPDMKSSCTSLRQAKAKVSFPYFYNTGLISATLYYLLFMYRCPRLATTCSVTVWNCDNAEQMVLTTIQNFLPVIASPWSDDFHLKLSFPASYKQSQWGCWQEIANGNHLISLLTTCGDLLNDGNWKCQNCCH